MYLFNRAESLTLIDMEQDELNDKQPNKKMANDSKLRNTRNTCKINVESTSDMSPIADKRIVESKMEHQQTRIEKTWSGLHSVSRCMRPILLLLKILALFPGVVHSRRSKGWRRTVKIILLLNFSLLAIMFNSYLLNKNMWLITAYKERFGLMHASTVSCIITGIKPMINIFILILFTLRIKEHLHLIRTLDSVDVSFRSAFHLSPPIQIYKYIFFFTVTIAFLLPFTFKVVEFIATEQKFGSSVIQDTAFIIVPVLTLWNIIPLLYYDMYNRITRFYCRILIKALYKEHCKRHFSLKFYYQQFLRITNVQEAIGSLFNPLILFSLAWSMLVLCLTIYFMTQPHSSLLEPISPEQITVPDVRRRLTRSVHFTICWAGLQVVVALMHILIICYTGMTTNETTRTIVNAVLRIVPEANADLDRFQISCFVYKMSTQFMWGMTVWRAFPLERTTFFTLVSVIVTYSFLLLKLKDNPAVMPIMRSFILENGTYITRAD